jgi:hypothetical protein
MATFEQHVRARTCTREEIDHFLDPEKLSWGQFDPEVGYILGNYLPQDGIDNSSTINTVQKNGTRSAALYADHPRRINTYGNSFTQGAQVSDQETWQEYLAAHIGEPIGNYGVGGFGVYQAYRRLIRAEETDEGAEYVILYIWGDDHHRSFFRCRRVSYPTQRSAVPAMFEGNFWAHLEMDMENGHLVEKEALLQTPESLYNMTDPDFMYDALKDDLMLQMTLFCRDSIQEIDIKPLNVLAEILGFSPDIPDQPEQQRRWIENLRHAYAFAGTRYIIEKALAFTQHSDKKLMIALYCPQVTRQLISTGKRYDQPIVDYLRDNQILYFDMNLVHAEDYTHFNLSLEDYMARYHIGHYSPTGNHFFAHSIKNPIIGWLSPKPITYRDSEDAMTHFRDYLPELHKP